MLEAAVSLIWRWRGVLEGELAEASGRRLCTQQRALASWLRPLLLCTCAASSSRPARREKLMRGVPPGLRGGAVGDIGHAVVTHGS